jgi:hypothetical protein
VRKRSPSRSVPFYSILLCSTLLYSTVFLSGSTAQVRSGHGMPDCLSQSEKGEEGEEDEKGWGVANYPAPSHPCPPSPSPSCSLPLRFRVSLIADTLTSHHITVHPIAFHIRYAGHTHHTTPHTVIQQHTTHYTAIYILHCTVPFFEYVTVQRTMISSTINTIQSPYHTKTNHYIIP